MIDKCRMVYYADCIGPTGESIGAYKIGCSYGFNNRVKQLASNLPFSLDVVAAVPGGLITEAAVHLFLKQDKIGGEYFRKSEAVCEYVDAVTKRGTAFWHFEEGATLRGDDKVEAPIVRAFMDYHGISDDEVVERLGLAKSIYAKSHKQRFGNRKWIAAIAVILCERKQYCTWPHDALAGVVGKKSRQLKQEAA